MNERDSLKQRAVRLLARREHTRAELARKLYPLGGREDIDAVLAELTATGLLSDERAAAAYVRGHAAHFGTGRLRQELRRKGVEDEQIEAALGGTDAADELARARAVWTKKFSGAPGDAKEWARQARFLQSRGFASDVIRKLLKETP